MTAVNLPTCRICHEIILQAIRQDIFFQVPKTEFNLLSRLGGPTDSRVKWQATSTSTSYATPRCIHCANLARSLASLWQGVII